MKETQKEIKYFKKREGQLDVAYQNSSPLWKEMAEYYLPRSCRFLSTEVNKKPKFSKKILDSSTSIAIRSFASGMMAGATNPVYKWFKAGIKNYDIKHDYSVKDWCTKLSTLLMTIFAESNFYNSLPYNYLLFGVFGISAMSIELDYENVINCKVLPLGSYKIAKDHRGVVNTLYRFYSDTVNNVVERFGIENVSNKVKRMYEKGNYETSVDLVHAVEPNQDYQKGSNFSNKKKFLSVYYEKKSTKDKFLERKGFRRFPFVVFEASVNGEDVYPSECPGIISFPDVKQLMGMVKKYHMALAKIVSPQLKGPSKFKGASIIDAPASYVAVDETQGNKLEPIYQVNPQVLAIKQDINEIKQIIGQIFYNHIFAMFANEGQAQPKTAYEWSLRKEESSVHISPLLQQIHSGLKQIIEIVFDICDEVGILPAAPEQIQDKEIDIEFVSSLAQAQKAYAIGGMERFVTYVSNIAATAEPTARYKVNWFENIDDYAEAINIEPDNVVPNDVVMARIAQMEKRQAQAENLAQLQQGSEIVKNMGGSDTSGGNIIERIGLMQ